MMLRIMLTIGAISMVFSGNLATAEEPDPANSWERPPVHFSPPGGELVTVDGEKLRCYTLDEGMKLSEIIIDYDDLFAAAIRWDTERAAYESKIGGLELRLSAQLGLVDLHKSDATWWRGLHTATREELHKNARSERFWWVPWALSAAIGIVWGITSSLD